MIPEEIPFLRYLKLLLLHVAGAVLVYLYQPASVLVLCATLLFWLFRVIQKENRNHEALLAAAYMAGSEVFFRMTGAVFFYELGKYAVILFLLLGMLYKSPPMKSFPYWIYLLILVPGVIIASVSLEYDEVFRKAIAFNLSGPFCLGVCAIYCYQRRISHLQLQRVLFTLLLPLLSTTAYLFLYATDIGAALENTTDSSFGASGGYGPNQMATVLGMGILILWIRLLVLKNRVINIIDFILFGLISFRALVTFSRGGVITAAVCMLCFSLVLIYRNSGRDNAQLFRRGVLLFVSVFMIGFFSNRLTGGLLAYRYENRDAAGRIEDDITTGRAGIIGSELEAFYKNPFFGAGVGKTKEFRTRDTGFETASHNEISRLLSEHGMLGLLAMAMLVIIPIASCFKHTKNYYSVAFLAFWFLTINHSAMRIALPALVYGLALLYSTDEKKKHPLYRKRS